MRFMCSSCPTGNSPTQEPKGGLTPFLAAPHVRTHSLEGLGGVPSVQVHLDEQRARATMCIGPVQRVPEVALSSHFKADLAAEHRGQPMILPVGNIVERAIVRGARILRLD